MHTPHMTSIKKAKTLILFVLPFLIAFSGCSKDSSDRQKSLKGWTILSANKDKALEVINHAGSYGINHLQLSHKIVHKLKHLRRTENRKLTNELIDSAHQAGIDEVVLWDHALYWLGYYPDKFKTGPDSTLNLDNPELWQWIKDDYREMLDLAPKADGIVLTFIETGAHIEDQHSDKLTTEEEKLAYLINQLSEVMKERDLKFYIRTFIYFPSELNSLLKCLDLIKNKDITVMSKEAPHDFFLTHPPTYWVKDIDYPVIMEFDGAHEFNGQGVVASIFPEIHLKRWKYYQSLPNVTGYVARTDRFKKSAVLGRPSEINLFALHEANQDSSVTADEIYTRFIEKQYGKKALPYLRPAFKNASEIITSVWYTLGLPVSDHSQIDFGDVWSYSGMVSGRWMDKPIAEVNHDVNKTFHYWKDVVNHLAPPRAKKDSGYLGREILWERREKGWIDTTEKMNRQFLNHIMTEKQYGVELARKSLAQIKKAKPHIKDKAAYDTLYHTFKRTELSARLFKATAQAYFGHRIYFRGEAYQSEELKSTIQTALDSMGTLAEKIQQYPYKGPSASYDWDRDAHIAMKYYHNRIHEKMKKANTD